MRAGSRWSTSEGFENPDDVVRRRIPTLEPIAELRSIGPCRGEEHFRERLARELVADGVPDARVLDMLLAGTEVFANAMQHGRGVEDVRVGRVDGRFVCEIADRGEGFDDPAAGYLAPREGTGSGLWVARQLTWRVEFLRGQPGFTARIWL
jgi:anti-sigma regulatory factor (Ser/Thr protein kinase)